jgi:hypothetical protein
VKKNGLKQKPDEEILKKKRKGVFPILPQYYCGREVVSSEFFLILLDIEDD